LTEKKTNFNAAKQRAVSPMCYQC